MGRQLDHLVYCVPDLDEACAYFANALGVKPLAGGKHPSMGTKNALLSLGTGAYFELLAVDTANTTVEGPRWMGIDLIQQSMMTRWSLKSDDLIFDNRVLHNHNYPLGAITTGARVTVSGGILEWQLIEPLSHPLVDVVPFFLDWSSSSHHPSQTIQNTCKLRALQLEHPDPSSMLPLFTALGIDLPLHVGNTPKISAVLEGPAGQLHIS